MTVVWIILGWIVLIVLICVVAHRADVLARRHRRDELLALSLSEIELYANAGGGA